MLRRSCPRRIRHLSAALFLITVLTLATGASAGTDLGWQIRFYAAAIDMNDGSGGAGRAGGAGFDLDVGAGLGFNAEYRFTPRFGLDLGILGGAGVDVETGTTWAGNQGWITNDTVTFTPLTAGLDIHLTPAARVDLYARPMVALVQYGGLVVRSGSAGIETDWDFAEDLAVGAALGLGVPFGGNHWSFQTSLSYLKSDIDGSSSNGLKITSGYDSTIFGFGLGYRFGQRAG